MEASFSSGNLELFYVSTDRQQPIEMLFENVYVFQGHVETESKWICNLMFALNWVPLENTFVTW